MITEIKQLVKQSAIYGIGATVSPLISLVMLPIYTRFLAPDDYGILAITNVVSLLLTAVIGMGVRSGLIRIHFSCKSKEERDILAYSSLLFALGIAALFIIISYPFIPYISAIVFHFNPEEELFYKLILYTMLFSILNGITFSILRAEEKAHMYTALTVSSLVLTLSLNILFVVVFKRKVVGILEAALISNIAIFIASFLLAFKGKKFGFSTILLKEVLSFGIPLVPGLVMDVVLSFSDRYFLEHYTTLTEVGIYSLGYRIASMISVVVISPFNTAWAPYMYSVAGKSNAKNIFKNVLIYYTYVAVWLGLGLSLFSREFLIIAATPAYYPAYRIVPIIVLSYALYGMMNILVAGIHITKNTREARKIFIIAGGLNLLLNTLLIPSFHIYGAAIATLLSYIYMNISFFFVSQKLYPIEHDFRKILSLLSCGILLYILGEVVLNTENISIHLLLKFFCWIAFPVILFFSRFHDKYEIQTILSFFGKFKVSLASTINLLRRKDED